MLDCLKWVNIFKIEWPKFSHSNDPKAASVLHIYVHWNFCLGFYMFVRLNVLQLVYQQEYLAFPWL